MAANIWSVQNFYKEGRGNYANALASILEHHEDGAPLSIGTDMVYQLQTVMDYTVARHAPGLIVTYVAYGDIPQVKPSWVISVTRLAKDLPATTCRGDLFYTLHSKHAYWGFAGTAWGVYFPPSTGVGVNS